MRQRLQQCKLQKNDNTTEASGDKRVSRNKRKYLDKKHLDLQRSIFYLHRSISISKKVSHFPLPWIRVAAEKPTAGPGGAKEEGRRGRLWSPWTSLPGTAPIRINIQNMDVGFHWFISDRSREITHSLLCNLLSGRSPTNQSTGLGRGCFNALLYIVG